MTFVADQNPAEVEWGTTPPPPLLEALETLWGLRLAYSPGAPYVPGQDSPERHWWEHVEVSYRTAYNVMLRAFHEEYAP